MGIFAQMTNIKPKIESVLARQTDGTIQITFTIPEVIISEERETAIAEIAKTLVVPGFRLGKAPQEKVKDYVPESKITEKLFSNILPNALSEAFVKFKIKPLLYPRFELINSKEGEDWQIRATTCEMPSINLGEYEKKISEASKSSKIWTPGKAQDENKKEVTSEEKEHEVIKILLATCEVEIPKPLVDEEVDARLAGLLERTERLGLSLEKYLESIGKTPESLRNEYEIQAKDALKLDMILAKIAEVKEIKPKDPEIDKVLSANLKKGETFEHANTPEQRQLISSVIAKREALDSLVSLL